MVNWVGWNKLRVYLLAFDLNQINRLFKRPDPSLNDLQFTPFFQVPRDLLSHAGEANWNQVTRSYRDWRILDLGCNLRLSHAYFQHRKKEQLQNGPQKLPKLSSVVQKVGICMLLRHAGSFVHGAVFADFSSALGRES